MLKRTLTGAVLVTLIALLLYFSDLPYLLAAAMTLLSVIAVYELYRAGDMLEKKELLAISEIMALAVSLASFPHYTVVLAVSLAVAMAAFLYMMLRLGSYTLTDSKLFLIALMLPVFFRAFTELRLLKNGLFYLVLLSCVCLLSDIFAYLLGLAFGKRKLAPRVSPGKSIAGAIGGVLVPTAVALAFCLIFGERLSLRIDYPALAVYLPTAAVVCQFGDLSMSVIKRNFGVKDYGKILPGHGGILDRFDSLVFSAPYTLLFMLVFPVAL